MARRTCIEVAVGLLARREHSELELERKLKGRDFEENEISSTLSRLLDNDLLSNERFVESFVRQRVSKGNGPVKIGYELRTRGISQQLANVALSPYQDDWIDIARSTHRKKFSLVAKEFEARVKQSRFLQYKGFTPEQISIILNVD